MLAASASSHLWLRGVGPLSTKISLNSASSAASEVIGSSIVAAATCARTSGDSESSSLCVTVIGASMVRW